NRRRRGRRRKPVNLPQHPDKFAQTGQSHRDQRCILKQSRCNVSLLPIIARHGPQQYVDVDGDFHFLRVFFLSLPLGVSSASTSPSHPSAVASLISSMVATFFVWPASIPMKSWMLPVGSAARTIPRPSGSNSSAIFPPGLTPRCCKTCFRKVTCP